MHLGALNVVILHHFKNVRTVGTVYYSLVMAQASSALDVRIDFHIGNVDVDVEIQSATKP